MVLTSMILWEDLTSTNQIVNKGLKELSKPLKKALHYVINELNKALNKLKKAIVHLRNSFRHQYGWRTYDNDEKHT